MKLGDITTVRSGLVLSRKAARETDGICYPLLNFKAIDDSGHIDPEELDVYRAEKVLAPEYLTHAGDVVVRLTAPYTAVLIDPQTEGLVISSNFIVIRADKRYVLPSYLYWLLNTQKFKHKIYENATSNVLGAVKARFFADYTWASVTIEDQQTIAELNRLAQQEVHLLHCLAREKEKYYAAAIQQFQKSKKVRTTK